MSRTVRDLMADAVVTADPGETVGEVRQRMSQHDISAVPVVDADGVLRGIVTSDDLVANYEATIPLSRVMNAPVQTVSPDDAAGEAARRMRAHRNHHLVVVEDDCVVGIVSSFDLLRLVEGS